MKRNRRGGGGGYGNFFLGENVFFLIFYFNTFQMRVEGLEGAIFLKRLYLKRHSWKINKM